MRWSLVINIVIMYYTVAVSGQGCTDTVGSLDHYSSVATVGRKYIFTGYTVPCSRTVVAWEFCYQVSDLISATFSPSIWRISQTSGIDYQLIQANTITYDSSIETSGINSCKRVNLSTTDQFTAPAGSLVGLYSISGPKLLYSNSDSSTITYRIRHNQSSITTNSDAIVHYNISIKVHLGK